MPSFTALLLPKTPQAPDLIQMEKIVLFHLSWRLRTPTSHSFLQLCLCGMMPATTAAADSSAAVPNLSLRGPADPEDASGGGFGDELVAAATYLTVRF